MKTQLLQIKSTLDLGSSHFERAKKAQMRFKRVLKS